MIVTRAKAEEAAGELGLTLVELLSKDIVEFAYKSMAKITHPDMPGGSVEAFARVDWAKQVLLSWLARPQGPTGEAAAGDCPACLGSGRSTVHKGFRKFTLLCGTCHGSGELPKERTQLGD